MNEITCESDFTHLRTEMTKKLAVIAKKLEHDILTIDQNNIQILNDIEEISKGLADLESRTSTYFLNCLLAEYTEYSAELSRTIHKLSLNRHGALIVIEKNDPVSPLINGGTSIQARVSSQLLESIFHPESPLHKGAVLLQSDLIISAANQLPFTQQIFWDRSFDPREMAAVGLSEQCDALILLVSDKGSTSFCVGGRLYPFSAK
ncbi:hypothetical protein SD71_12775 [Cohnella kolymensis]|uniref:DAC domain-containing protein n=1 Tax=Cohnella kolymensis TaxID=1590652 RepID=A0ABR5A4Q6_9BACL|nr:diadenylate cyclase [Cohnella kolymensis]KIL35530.1 hypothetical protein SD71_12775 [Cohnella kolymensis]